MQTIPQKDRRCGLCSYWIPPRNGDRKGMCAVDEGSLIPVHNWDNSCHGFKAKFIERRVAERRL